jgi:pre-mRNA cleavage complex 2 protein Pcf11
MEEMLVTWRTGGPSGVELFGQTVQLTIERVVWGDMSSGSSGPTPNQVLIELDVILAQKTRAVDQNPADMESKSHIEVLQQVCCFE